MQFIPGGLIHWVDYGFQTTKSLEEKDPQRAKELRDGAEQRWLNGLNLFSKFDTWRDDLHEMYTLRSSE